MSSAHTHARTHEVFLRENLSIFRYYIMREHILVLSRLYLHRFYMLQLHFYNWIESFARCWWKIDFLLCVSFALPACLAVCVCLLASARVCVGNYAKWSTMKFAALVPLLDTNSVGIFYLTVLSFFQPSSPRCFNTGNALTHRERERNWESFLLVSCNESQAR